MSLPGRMWLMPTVKRWCPFCHTLGVHTRQEEAERWQNMGGWICIPVFYDQVFGHPPWSEMLRMFFIFQGWQTNLKHNISRQTRSYNLAHIDHSWNCSIQWLSPSLPAQTPGWATCRLTLRKWARLNVDTDWWTAGEVLWRTHGRSLQWGYTVGGHTQTEVLAVACLASIQDY